MTNYYNCSAEYYRKAPHHKIMIFGLVVLFLGMPAVLLDFFWAISGNETAQPLFVPILAIWITTPMFCLTIWAHFDGKLAKTNEQLRQEAEKCQGNQ